MNFDNKKNVALGVSVLLSAVLTACGGGGGTSTTASYDIAGTSTATASSLGLSALGVSSSDTAALPGANNAIELTAAIGDSWRLVWKTDDSNPNIPFIIRPLVSSYELVSDSSEGNFSQSTSGNVVAYTGTFGQSGANNSGSVSIRFDKRTKSVIGDVKWRISQSKELISSVTGTQYIPGNGFSLANISGDYVFANQAVNQTDGSDPSSTAGTLNISSTGLIKVCPKSKFNAAGNVCKKLDGTTPTDGSQTPIALQAALSGSSVTLAPTTAPGTTTLTLPNGIATVKAHIQAGDLGPVLVIDQDWLNDSQIRRTGILVAARIGSIDAGKFAGTFYCPTVQIGNETAGATITASSTSFSAQKNGTVQTGTIAINKVYDQDSIERDMPGAFHLTSSSNGQTFHQFGYQLSSSLFIFQGGGGTRLNFCQRI